VVVSYPAKATDEQILTAYAQAGSCAKAATLLGMSAATVHQRLKKLGASRKPNIFTQAERQHLAANYDAYVRAGQLECLAREMGRTKQFLCRKAKEMGLTNCARPKHPHIIAAMRAGQAEANANGNHPRGMAGKKHSAETRAAIAKKSAEMWSSLDEDGRAAQSLAMMKAKLDKHGTLVGIRPHGKWKADWREIGGQRRYYRSRWEANYARYLQWLLERGEISSWDHEPQTFWFEAIKRGVRSYKPDFLVFENSGHRVWHEVKGWMDSRSKTTLRRMSKYYPEEQVIVIDGKQYRQIANIMAPLLPDWEYSGKGEA
jgi:hypothetical protein